MVTYRKAGVDIKKAEIFVKKIKDKSTEDPFSSFASLFDVRFLKEYKHPLLVSSSDGVGTKLKIAQALGIHSTVGIDLVAMNVNDIVCLGAKPLFFLDYIACGKIKVNVLSEVVKGIKKGVKEADCVLIGGETAEMPGMYDRDEYDLAGFCVGIVDKHRIIDGSKIKEDDTIIGLASSGIHSNGYSLVRKVLTNREVAKHGRQLLKPTRIYVKPVLSVLDTIANKRGTIKGIAHITGGAFYSKATKILPKGLGMVIKKKSWPVPRIFRIIQNKGKIREKEMYSVFNMGIGMIVVVEPDIADSVISLFSSFKINAYNIGYIARSNSKIILED